MQPAGLYLAILALSFLERGINMKIHITIAKTFTLKMELTFHDLSELVNVIQLAIWLYGIVRLVMLFL